MISDEDVRGQFARLVAAAKRVCDERLLVHRGMALSEGEMRLMFNPKHSEDCPACALREAVDALGIGERAPEGAS